MELKRNIAAIKRSYDHLSNPVKASFWFTVCSVIQKGISLITVPFFTRLMTPEQYGQYSLYLSWDSIIIVFATLNLSYQVFNNGLLKYRDNQDEYTSAMLGLSNFCTTLLLIPYLLFSGYVNEVTGLTTPLFLLMFLQYYVNQALALWTVKERFHYKYKVLTSITLASAVVSSALGVVAVYLAQDKVFARVASLALVNVVVGGAIYLNVLRRSPRLVNFEYWKFVLRINLPLIPHYLSMTALASADRILIANICGESFTAYYSISYNVAAIINLLISSVNSSYNPWFYQNLSEGNVEKISSVTNALLIAVGSTCFIPILFGPEAISLLGSSGYHEAIWVMPSVAIGVFFVYLYSLFSNFELYHENSKLMMIASVSAAILNIVLNIIFLPKFGFIAAGYTTLACYIALALFHYCGMKKICMENEECVIPFNVKTIAVISFLMVLLSVISVLLYLNTMIRYGILGLALFIIFINKNKIINLIRMMMG